MLLHVLVLFFAAADFNAQLRAGLDALNKNDLAHARQNLEAASRLQPRNPEVWIALAQTYRGLKSPTLAEAAAVKAETFATKSPATIHALAVYYAQAANFDKAASLESRYAATNEDANADAAVLWIRAGKPRAAIEYARRAAARDSKRGDLHALLAAAYDGDDQLENATAEYQRAIEQSPYEEAYYRDLARMLVRHQRFPEAQVVLDSSRKVFDRSPVLETETGLVYYSQRHFADAVSCFLRAIQYSPDSDAPYILLGRMLDDIGDRMPEVMARIEAWYAANPRNAAASLVYAKAVMHAGGNDAKAEKLLRDSIALNDKDWESHYTLGVLFEREQKLNEAAAEFKVSAGLDPKQPDPRAHLARITKLVAAPSK